MKRISYDTFIRGSWGEGAYVIKVRDGKLYMKAWVEEWPNGPEELPADDNEYYRILSTYLEPGIELNTDVVMLAPLLDAVISSEDYNNPLYFNYEADDEDNTDRADFVSVYDCLCRFATPVSSEKYDFNIFVFSKEELQDLCAFLRDEDYILVLE